MLCDPAEVSHLEWYLDRTCGYGPHTSPERGIWTQSFGPSGDENYEYVWDGRWHRLSGEEMNRFYELVRGIRDELWANQMYYADALALAWFAGSPWDGVEAYA